MASSSYPSSKSSSSAASAPARKYIPPALRFQPTPSSSRTSDSGSSSAPGPSRYSSTSTYQARRPLDDNAGPSRYAQPASSVPYDYSREDPYFQAQNPYDQGPSRRNHISSYPQPQSQSATSAYIPPSQRSARPPTASSSTFSHSAPSPRRRYVPETAHLFLAGDSFVGALSPAKGPQPKELPGERGTTEEEQAEYAQIKKEWEVYDAIPKMIKIRKEKGAAAKGLNNPRSKKNIAPKILDHGMNAFGDLYHDYNKNPRFFMMMFGNVDLNINYLWQLVNRQITSKSFTPEELALAGNHLSDLTTVPSNKRKGKGGEASADHTENDLSETALGPTLFVAKVVREYTSFIEREIVNGPIGRKLLQFHEAANDIHARGLGPSKNKVLVAGALPPMVHDRNLYRILGKYVEQHVEQGEEKKDVLVRRPSKRERTPPPVRGDPTISPTRSMAAALTPASAPYSNSSRSTESSDQIGELSNSVNTILTIPDSASDKEDQDSEDEDEDEDEQEQISKSTFSTLLSLRPSPCTLQIRSQMIQGFNTQLSQFCSQHPKILKFITINESMATSHPGDENLLDYYCSQVPGDGANVHPTWERTYPLWLEVLREQGVDVDSFPDVDLEGTEAAWTAEKGLRLESSKYKT